MMDLRRLAPLALLVPAVAAGATLKPRWPKDQSIHYALGDASQRVEELDARWALSGEKGADDWSREATFRYAPGTAPRTVAHSARLADGDYVAEIEIRAGSRTAVVQRKVTLEGGSTTLDLAAVVP
jgi:hypothetical protein